MIRYSLRRIGSSLVTIAVMVCVVFLAARVLPGDPARIIAGNDATEEDIARVRGELGLDQPLIVQFGDYLSGILRGDLGDSIRTQQPVLDELMRRLPATLELALFAFLIAIVLGVGLGVLGATFRGTWIDGAVRGIAVVGTSIPSFWLALVGIMVLVYGLHLFPSPIDRLPTGVVPPPDITGLYVVDALLSGKTALAGVALRQLALPGILLGVLNAVSVLKITRASMVESLESDFVRTARTFGVPRRRLIFQDGLRSALPPVITSIGLVAGHLVAGNIIIERIYSWPGIGQYLSLAVESSDFPAITGFILLVGVGYVVVNLIVDFLYVAADPRIQIAGGATR
jgi:peptide/nickel transport system permease protein